MSLGPGTKLGLYEIVAPLGAGGMGEVYRARDTKLNRDVAIKILPDAFAHDADRVARFTREAQTLAALNHPNIAQVYGVLEEGAPTHVHALVMELVEGEDLSALIARGAAAPGPEGPGLRLEEALSIARQIAEALEAAHEQGIVHRDLKPANVKVRPDGTVKVLDFGLAKAMDPAGASGPDVANSPTIPARATQMGMILGTAAYMAPEQARGKAVDKRADIWAFGVVLYEMLTDRRAYHADDVSDTLAAVLTRDVDWAAIPPGTPPRLLRLLERCLERDAKLRLRDIGEARVLLSGPLEPPAPSAAVSPATRRAAWPGLLGWLVAAAATAVAVMTALRPVPAVPTYGPGTIRLMVAGPALEPGAEYTIDPTEAPVVSPDGRTLAVVLTAPDGKAVYLRPLDGSHMVRVDGGGGGRRPFFSPDGRSLAFFRSGGMWTMDLTERRPGLVGRLDENPWDLGFPAWHPDGRLLVPGAAGLWSMPASGGDATLMVASDASRQERFETVNVLRDGRLAVEVRMPDGVRVEILPADGRERRAVASGLERGVLADDVLLTKRDGQWRAVRVDAARFEPVGSSIPLSGVPEGTPIARSLAWIDGSSILRELVWVSRTGAATPVGIAPAYMRWPRLSPDGLRVALGLARDTAGRSTSPAEESTTVARRLGPWLAAGSVPICVLDLKSGARAALQGNSEPVWLPDGRAAVTSMYGGIARGLAEQVADGSRPMDTVLSVKDGDAWPTDVSRDAAWLVYYGVERDGRVAGTPDLGDLFVLNRRTKEKRRLPLPGYQRGGRLSPDGRWLAFQSAQRDTWEVHVRPFPSFDADYRLSADGGDEPAWSADGKELYFRRGPDMMAVRVPTPGAAGGWPPAQVLFTGGFARDHFGDQSYDVTRDGRFLMMRPAFISQIHVQMVFDWMAEVRARLAAGR